jgi:hypothetical protein
MPGASPRTHTSVTNTVWLQIKGAGAEGLVRDRGITTTIDHYGREKVPVFLTRVFVKSGDQVMSMVRVLHGLGYRDVRSEPTYVVITQVVS